jgi:hypothetical protein
VCSKRRDLKYCAVLKCCWSTDITGYVSDCMRMADQTSAAWRAWAVVSNCSKAFCGCFPARLSATSRRATVHCGRPGFIAVTAAVEIHELAGPALTHPELLNEKRHIGSQTGKLQPFLRTIALSTFFVQLRSAAKCFNLRFSSSRLFRRCTSLTSKPPYLLFYV